MQNQHRHHSNRKLLSSIVLLNQVAVAPALANSYPAHASFAAGPTVPQTQPHSFHNNGVWQTHAATQFLPASFGLGVVSLPTASQSLPLPQTSMHQAAVVNHSATHFASHAAITQSTIVQPAQNVQLDLTSSTSSVVLDSTLIKTGSSVTIQMGTGSATFHVGDKVTAGELVAIEQAQVRTGQTIKLDDQGRATGGTFSLNSVTNAAGLNVSSVVVPNDVTAIDRVAAHSNVSLSGDLINYGSIVEVGLRHTNNSANISAQDIINEAGGLITSKSFGGSTDLSLTATQDFTNMGTISSSGNLSITAGGSLTNNAAISAPKDISLQSTNIVNTGAVVSSHGNINLGVAGDQSRAMHVNNNGGTISAVNGAINVRQADYAGTGNTSVIGGDLLSKQLNLNSGSGMIDVNVNELTGTVTSQGEGVHVQASTDNLVLGKQCLIGDPTYYNDKGDITVTSDINVGEDLAIIASGDVTVNPTVTSISANDGVNGRNITIVAGANVTGTANDPATTIPTNPSTTGSVSFSGASATGGNVTLPSGLTVSSGSGTGNGGNIVIAAYYPGTGFQGTVKMTSNTTLDATASGTAGNVTILAGSAAAASTTGTINAQDITISTSQPSISGGGTITFNANGAVTSGNAIVRDFSASVNGSAVNLAGNITATGNVNISSNSPFVQASTIATTTGNIIITSIGTLDQSGFLQTTKGGNIVLVSGQDIATVKNATISTETNIAGVTSGSITMVAGAAFSETATSLKITGPSATGGDVNLFNAPGGGHGPIAQLSSKYTGAAGNGGTITLVAYADAATSTTGGGVIVPAAVTVTTGGVSGTSGDVIVVANGKTDAIGTVANKFNADTTGGTTGTGNITLSSSLPNGVTIDTTTGTLNPQAFLGGTINSGKVNYGPLTTSAATLKIVQGGGYTFDGTLPASSNIVIETDGTIAVTGAITTSLSVALLTSGSIDLQANLNTTGGGLLLAAGGDIKSSVAGVSISTAQNTVNSGSISLLAGANFTDTNNVIAITGASATGGVIDLSTSAISALSTKTSNFGLTSGNITLLAFSGTNEGRISLPGALTVDSSAFETAGGSFTAVAGANTGTAIDLFKVNTTPQVANNIAGSAPITLQAATPNVTTTLAFSTSGAQTSGDPTSQTNNTLWRAGEIHADTLTSQGGSIFISNLGNVQIQTLDASGRSDIGQGPDNGHGGTITVKTSPNVDNLLIGANTGNNFINSVLANGVAGGLSPYGGSVTIQLNGTADLAIESTTAIKFAAPTGAVANSGNMTLQALKSDLDLGPLTGVDANPNGASICGYVNLSGNNITWDTRGTGAGPFTLTALGPGGQIVIDIRGTGNYSIGKGVNDDFKYTVTGGSGFAGFFSGGALKLDSSAIDASATGNNNGNTIFLQAKGISSTTPIVLNASGSGTGSGGTINIEDDSTANIVIGTGAGQYSLTAQSGATPGGKGQGNGGTIFVIGNGNMTVDPTQLKVAPLAATTTANGGTLDLEANGGALLINGNLNVNGGTAGTGGSINLQSKSATPFSITGTKLTNGITGTLSVTGGTKNGSISVFNAGGGVISNSAITAVDSLDESCTIGSVVVNSALGDAKTSNITLAVGTGGSVTATKAPVLAAAVALFADGAISVSKLNTSSVTFNTNMTKTGVVTITNTGAGPLDIAGGTGNKITIVTPGNLTTSDIINGGTVTLTSTAKTGTSMTINKAILATGAVTLTAPGSITTEDIVQGGAGIKITNKDAGANIITKGQLNSLNTATIAITSGAGSILQTASSSIDGAKAATLSATKGSITVGGVGDFTEPLALTATALNGITVLGGIKATNSVTLKATSTVLTAAPIILNQAVAVSSSKGTLAITSGSNSSIDDSTSPFGLTLKAATVTLAGPGGINLTKTDVTATTKALTVGSTKGFVTVQSLTATLANVAISSFSSLVLDGPITAATSVTAKTVDTKNSADIFLHHNITAGTAGSIILTAVGQGAILTSGTKINPNLQAGTLTLTGATGVDLSVGVFLTSASKSITLTAAKGDVSMNFNGSVDAKTNLTISALNVTSSAPIKAVGPIVMTATDKLNGQISLSNNIDATGPGSKITINTGNASLNNAFQNKGGSITANGALTIKASSGSVTNTGGIQSTTGAISITGTDYDGTGGNVTAGLGVTITGTGKTALDSVIAGTTVAQNGGITIKGAGGSVTVSSLIDATGLGKVKAPILINASNTTPGTTISINGQVSNHGTGGNVTIAIGTAPTTGKNPLSDLQIANIKVSNTTTGQVFGGVNLSAIQGPLVGTATLGTINAANVILNSANSANQIKFGTGASVVADPPAVSANLVHVSTAAVPIIATMPSLAAVDSDHSVVFLPSSAPGMQGLSQSASAAQTANLISSNNSQALPLLGGVTVYQMSNRTNSGDGSSATEGLTTYGRRSANGYGPGVAWISDTELAGGKIPAALQQSAGETQLDSGALLVASGSDSVVKTALGNIAIKAKSLVLVLKFSGGLAVYNLHDTSKNAVQLEIGGQTTSIQPGRSVIVATGQRKRFEEVNPAQLICYGPLKESNLASDLKIFNAEFSLPSAINAVPTLRNLLNSGNARDKKLAEQFLKTTSIMMQLRGNTTNFRQVLKPQLTACNQ